MQAKRKSAASKRRGAAQLVLVMLVILVISVSAAGAVRHSISARRIDQQRARSLTLERMLQAAEQWQQAGGEVDAAVVTLRLPTQRPELRATVDLQRLPAGDLQLTATLSKQGRTVGRQSRKLAERN